MDLPARSREIAFRDVCEVAVRDVCEVSGRDIF